MMCALCGCSPHTRITIQLPPVPYSDTLTDSIPHHPLQFACRPQWHSCAQYQLPVYVPSVALPPATAVCRVHRTELRPERPAGPPPRAGRSSFVPCEQL